MRMKFTFKSLLLAAGLLVGSTNAWAETTTLLEYGTSTTPWADESLSIWTGTTPSIEDGYLHIEGDNGSYESATTISPEAGTVINLTAVWRGHAATGRAFADGNGSYFRFGNIVVAQNDQNQSHGYLFNGLDNIASITTFSAGTYRNNDDKSTWTWLLIEAEINTATNTLTSFTVKSEDGTTTYVNESNVSLPSADYSVVAFGYKKSGRVSYTNVEDLKSIKITQTTQSVSYADYTVHFVDTEGNTVKDDDTRSGEVGSTVHANANDMISFKSVDEEYKYVYKDDNGGTTVTDGDKAELTITYNKYGKYTATVDAVKDGATLKSSIVSSSVYEDETAIMHLPKYISVEGVWYSTEDNLTQSATKADNIEISYTASDIDYFFEETDFTFGAGKFAATQSSDLFSNGSAGRLQGNSYVYSEPLKEGVYEMFIVGAATNAKKPTLPYGYKFTGDETYTLVGESKSIESSTYETTTVTVAIPEGASLCLINNTGDNSNFLVDYITLTRIDNVSITISKAGYSTFSSEYAVTIPEGLTAYIATATDVNEEYEGTITLQEVEGTVAANTGLLLKGDADQEYNLPVSAEEGESYEGVNLLKPTAADGKVAEGNYIFAYNNSDASECGFYYLESEVEVGAGKAYLDPEATAAGINVLRFVFGDGTATAIEAPAAEAEADGAIYNVAGQQVGSDYKGIVIKNGKKYLNK